MIFIDNEGITKPQINLALEDFALRNFGETDDYLLFYINEPSIIIGRNQNTLEEINSSYVEEKGIHVVRRMSRSEEHTSELQSRGHIVCRLLLAKKKDADTNLNT